MTKTIINRAVNVTSIGFRKNLAAYPRQMEFEGRTYDFVDQGLSCVIRHGDASSQILTLSDGPRQFRLRSDNRGGSWTLLSISA
jgi:hypothetical protein